MADQGWIQVDLVQRLGLLQGTHDLAHAAQVDGTEQEGRDLCAATGEPAKMAALVTTVYFRQGSIFELTKQGM